MGKQSLNRTWTQTLSELSVQVDWKPLFASIDQIILSCSISGIQCAKLHTDENYAVV